MLSYYFDYKTINHYRNAALVCIHLIGLRMSIFCGFHLSHFFLHTDLPYYPLQNKRSKL